MSLRRYAAVLDAAETPREDWCEEHSVPESQCVECNPDLLPPAKDYGWKAVMGDTPALDPAERSKSDLIILWGLNAAATSIHSMADAQAARRRGAQASSTRTV